MNKWRWERCFQLFLVVIAIILGYNSVFAAETSTFCGSPSEVNLYAGQTIDIGNVTAYNDGDKLYVKYTTKGGWTLKETHLFAGTSLSDIPLTSRGNPKVGIFPNQMAHPSVTEYTYIIDLAEAGFGLGTWLYIAAHADAELLDEDGTVVQQETAWAAGDDFPGRNWATYFMYELQDCETIWVDAGLSVLNIPLGTSSNIAFTVNFKAIDSNTYNIEFSQDVSPDTNGISLSTDFPPGWTTNSSHTWLVNETITGHLLGTYQLTTVVTINETGQNDQVTTTVNVISGEDNPVLKPLGCTPDAIPLSTPTDVLFSTALTGSTVKPSQVTVEQVDEYGNTIAALGQLNDEALSGDLEADDFVFSGTFSLTSDVEEQIFFKAKAIFSGGSVPVDSPTHTLIVTRFPTDIQAPDMSKVISDPNSDDQILCNQIMVSFIESTNPDSIEFIVASEGGTIVGTILGLGYYQIEVPDTGDETGIYSAISAMLSHSEVKTAEPVGIGLVTAVTPNDTLFSSQWGLTKIRADEAWVVARGKATIGVLDTGADYNHQDLDSKIIKGRNYHAKWWEPWNWWDPVDGHSHGTHVSGIAAAETNNSTGVAGVSWGSKVLAVKVCDDAGSCPHNLVAKGIKYAADHGVKIINLSLRFNSSYDDLKSSVEYAVSKGVLVIAAAGNDGDANKNYPAAYPAVFSIGNTTSSDGRYTSSNYGSWVDIAAPGTSIRSTVPNNSYGYMTGTSMAAPMVAGAAAVVWSGHPSWTAAKVQERLERTAKPLSSALQLGTGRIDLFEAVFNGSFEIGDLSEWTKTGTASSLSSLGPLTPVDRNGHKKRMGYVSTGPSADYVSSKLTQTFDIQSGVNSIPISFDYNFVTEEYPEWVGSIYDDKLRITLITPSGNIVTLAAESVNGSTFIPVGGIDFPGGDNTVGMTNWQTSTVNVLVTEGAGTYEIFVEDAGDDIYDSVVLIDNIRFK